MTRTPQEATEHTIRVAKRHVVEQETRIERQIRLIASLEAYGHTDMVGEAHQLLAEMNSLLARMTEDPVKAKASQSENCAFSVTIQGGQSAL